MPKPITELIPLELRDPGEEVFTPAVVSGVLLHTLIMEPIDLSEVEALASGNYLESFVVLPKTDGTGTYVSALVTTAQLRELNVVNQTYRLAERGLIACVLEEFPEFAKNESGPAHMFLGVPVNTISGVFNE